MREDVGKVERAERREDEQHAETETEIADARRDESFLTRRCCFGFVKPKRNQQVRTQADEFPSDVHQQIVAAEHEHQHRKDKEVEVRKEVSVPVVALRVHIADGVDVDEKADACDDEEHQRGKGIEQERDVNLKIGDRYPGKQGYVEDAVVLVRGLHREEREERNDERRADRAARDYADEPAREFARENCVDCRAREWERGDEPERVDQVNNSLLKTSSGLAA